MSVLDTLHSQYDLLNLSLLVSVCVPSLLLCHGLGTLSRQYTSATVNIISLGYYPSGTTIYRSPPLPYLKDLKNKVSHILSGYLVVFGRREKSVSITPSWLELSVSIPTTVIDVSAL